MQKQSCHNSSLSEWEGKDFSSPQCQKQLPPLLYEGIVYLVTDVGTLGTVGDCEFLLRMSNPCRTYSFREKVEKEGVFVSPGLYNYAHSVRFFEYCFHLFLK